MDRQGQWSLSPAYDITYSYNPAGAWTSSHQMTINGKRDDFTRGDITALGAHADLTARQAERVLDEIIDVVSEWPSFAEEATVDPAMAAHVASNLRLSLR